MEKHLTLVNRWIQFIRMKIVTTRTKNKIRNTQSFYSYRKHPFMCKQILVFSMFIHIFRASSRFSHKIKFRRLHWIMHLTINVMTSFIQFYGIFLFQIFNARVKHSENVEFSWRCWGMSTVNVLKRISYNIS